MASFDGSESTVKSDKYRSHIYGEGEKNTVWRFGGPPNYDVVNKLFEEGRTQVWEEGSPEEKVQRLLKTWEMEIFHKVRLEDFKPLTLKNTHSALTVKITLNALHRTFPRGFAIEIIQVYSGPPTIMYKFRHWAYMEGPFKGRAPTGEKVQFHGIGMFQVDDAMKVEKVELFYDPGELLGPLLKVLNWMVGRLNNFISRGLPVHTDY
ncbi:hypothetical protein GIB67_005061 [Kingdonia uniflora]|uniref:Pathogen-related protein n=1 Tax=Kingdonia uniflora TaxID=39325 RepID=A0A7J7LGV9_9MAGN|nr:hypothetical protein GIB67_005061 [Kingdonia uniflora]